jgi:hypothetical protein
LWLVEAAKVAAVVVAATAVVWHIKTITQLPPEVLML